MRITKVLALVCFFTFGLISNVEAWNFTGHVLIAQIAYENLTPEIRVKADKLAVVLFDQLPHEQQRKLNDHYPDVSLFAKLSIMPDVWRKWHLITLFNKFGASVPQDLLSYSNYSTANLHFIDTPYPIWKTCYFDSSHNVVWGISEFNKSMVNTHNDKTQALLMVMVEHYVGDVHQPLHVATNVASECKGDRGGNAYCLKLNRKGKCSKNLHVLWDSGIGMLKPSTHILQLAYELQRRYPRANFSRQLKNTAPQSWANEGYENLVFIYSTKQYTKPSPDYYRNAQKIAQAQLVLAGYRLADVLNNSL